MSYSAEPHRSTGDLITAAIWNQAVSDNPAAIYAGAMSITSQATNDLPYFSSSTQIGRIAAAASSVLVTSAGSVPSLSSTLPAVDVTAGAKLTASQAADDLFFGASATTLKRLAKANSSVLATNGSGVASWVTTLPAVNGAALTGIATLLGTVESSSTDTGQTNLTGVSVVSLTNADVLLVYGHMVTDGGGVFGPVRLYNSTDSVELLRLKNNASINPFEFVGVAFRAANGNGGNKFLGLIGTNELTYEIVGGAGGAFTWASSNWTINIRYDALAAAETLRYKFGVWKLHGQ